MTTSRSSGPRRATASSARDGRYLARVTPLPPAGLVVVEDATLRIATATGPVVVKTGDPVFLTAEQTRQVIAALDTVGGLLHASVVLRHAGKEE